MIARILAMSVLLAVLGGAPASGQQSNSPLGNIVVTGQQYENKVVCRYEQDTGSRFQKRTCHTNKEWDEMREQAQRDAHDMIDRTLIDTCRDSSDNCGSGQAPRLRLR